MKSDKFTKLKELITKEKKIITEINSLIDNIKDFDAPHDRELVLTQINALLLSLKLANNKIPEALKTITLFSPLNQDREAIKQIMQTPSAQPPAQPMPQTQPAGINKNKTAPKFHLDELEKGIIKRIGKGKIFKQDKTKTKANPYAKFASRLFSNFSNRISREEVFKMMKKDLIRSNLEFTPQTYISISLLTVLISAAVGLILTVLLLFFNFSSLYPFISLSEEDILSRFLKVIWIFVLLPPVSALFMFFYPSMEKGAIESKINQELTFATIHMSAIAGSSIEPIKIFEIINSTKEYPNLEREFKKIINEINVYGLSLISALRKVSYSTSSKKLSELLNGIAITLTSGGDLSAFFDKRSETFLFDYKIEREKYAKSAETFMDIYISVVIAAPMILMLMIVLMQVAGLGLSLSPKLTSILMILGVAVVNVLFLGFLKVKQPTD
jgi:hypothetical protein